MARRVGITLLSAVFGLLAAIDVVQLAQAARGAHPDPPGLLLTHGLTGGLAGVAAVTIGRTRPEALPAILGWGGITCAMLLALGPVLNVPSTERPQLWWAAALVAAFTLAAGWYVRRSRRDGAA